MKYVLILLICHGAPNPAVGLENCFQVAMPGPGAGYASEAKCREAGELEAAARQAADFACRSRMDPSGEMGA